MCFQRRHLEAELGPVGLGNGADDHPGAPALVGGAEEGDAVGDGHRRPRPRARQAVVGELGGVAQLVQQQAQVDAQLVAAVGGQDAPAGHQASVASATDGAAPQFLRKENVVPEFEMIDEDALPPANLEEDDDAGDEAGPGLFQHEERLRRADEDLGDAVDDVAVKVLLLDEDAHAVAVRAAAEVGPRVLRHHLVPGRLPESKNGADEGGKRLMEDVQEEEEEEEEEEPTGGGSGRSSGGRRIRRAGRGRSR